MFRTVLKVAVSVIGLKEMCNVPDMFNTFFFICIIQRDTFICSAALVIHSKRLTYRTLQQSPLLCARSLFKRFDCTFFNISVDAVVVRAGAVVWAEALIEMVVGQGPLTVYMESTAHPRGLHSTTRSETR